jgi:hypothetical protein
MKRVIIGAVVGLFAGAFVALVVVDAPLVPPFLQGAGQYAWQQGQLAGH